MSGKWIKDIEKANKRNAFKAKVRNVKDSVVRKTNEALTWMVAHPQETAIISSVALYLGKTANNFAKSSRAARDERIKKTRAYDHAGNHYVYTRHELTADEWRRVYERKNRTGETLTEVLYQMGYLKY